MNFLQQSPSMGKLKQSSTAKKLAATASQQSIEDEYKATKAKRQKSIDIHLVEKQEVNINKIKKNNINVNFYKNIPKRWKGDIIFFAVKPQDFYNVAKEVNTNNISCGVPTCKDGERVNISGECERCSDYYTAHSEKTT